MWKKELITVSVEYEQWIKAADNLRSQLGQKTEELLSANTALKASIHELQERTDFLDTLYKMFWHDLKKPMGGIMLRLAQLQGMSTELLVQGQIGEVRSDMESLVDFNRNIGDLLQVYNRKAWTQEAFSLCECLHEAHSFHSASLTHYKIDVTVSCEEGLRLVGYPSFVQAIFRNLLSNAWKTIVSRMDNSFGEFSQGRIEVRAGLESEEWVRVEVTDNGEGIPPDVQATLFQSAALIGETNLGSRLITRFVQLHGGSIEIVDTAEDQGSHIRLRLPLHPPTNHSN